MKKTKKNDETDLNSIIATLEAKKKKVVKKSAVEKAEKVNKNMTLAEIIDRKPDAVEKLLAMGLGCVGCHFSQYETLEEGALSHGMDPDEILEEINEGS